MRILVTLQQPDEGTIRLGGIDVVRQKEDWVEVEAAEEERAP
jgi:hypothetical protein